MAHYLGRTHLRHMCGGSLLHRSSYYLKNCEENKPLLALKVNKQWTPHKSYSDHLFHSTCNVQLETVEEVFDQ
jgi:hypothetical protein